MRVANNYFDFLYHTFEFLSPDHDLLFLWGEIWLFIWIKLYLPIFFFVIGLIVNIPLLLKCHYRNILHCIHTFFVFTGSYFARDARYSSKFCHSTSKHNFILQRHGMAPAIFQSDPPYKCMFLARVLVGEYTLGHPQYCRPPSKDTSIANFFDSCVDDMINPKIFVIFDSNQIYPEYLIEFYWCQRPKESQHKLC